MLTVWSVCNGDKYSDSDVYILRDMVARNLDQPHRFRCLADRLIPGIDCLIPEESWPGWWAKLLLFKYGTGHCLYLDLDTVVVGPLDDLVSKRLAMPANWGQSGHGGCQSSVMSWGQDYSGLYRYFDPDELIVTSERHSCGRFRGLWGDQEFITRLMGSPGEAEVVPMTGVYSYKYHCREGLPHDAVVVSFHGDPKPGEVSDSWVVNSRSTPIPA